MINFFPPCKSVSTERKEGENEMEDLEFFIRYIWKLHMADCYHNKSTKCTLNLYIKTLNKLGLKKTTLNKLRHFLGFKAKLDSPVSSVQKVPRNYCPYLNWILLNIFDTRTILFITKYYLWMEINTKTDFPRTQRPTNASTKAFGTVR